MDAIARNIRQIREQLLDRGIKAAAILGFFTLAGSLSRILTSGWHPLMLLHIGLYLIVLGLALLGKYLSYTIKTELISGGVFVLGIGILFGGGFASFGILCLFCFCIFNAILAGNRAGINSCLISILVLCVIAICVHYNILRFEPSEFLELNSTVLWITAILVLTLSAGIIVVVLGSLNDSLEGLARTLEIQNKEIREKNHLLEEDIAQRDRMEKERRQLEEKLRIARKLETIGQLAGGVAHDLNNTLGSIISYPELLLMDLPENSPLREPLEKIKKTGFKAATIVNDMLTLARGGILSPEVFDINTVIAEYLRSPEYEQLIAYHPHVKVEINKSSDPLNIRGSFFHITKVLMNLVSNATEAMPDGGRVVISTGIRDFHYNLVIDGQAEPGECVFLSVSDTGVGIPQEDLEKIFEPFFTKKKMGRSGTGLGMSVVWNAVKDHGGNIKVESTVGKGTTFTVYIPMTDKSPTLTNNSFSRNGIKGKGETILVVDDVEEQREIAQNLLQKMGYSVYAVESGEAAIEFLKRKSADLLILDMIMDPGIDGLETYLRILEDHPGQRTIIVSGYSETERVQKAMELGAGTYLKKPYLYEQIGSAVRKELDSHRGKIIESPGRWN